MTSRISEQRTKVGQGFTLIELLLVVSIIVLLTSVALPRLNTVTRRSTLEGDAEALADLIRQARRESIRRALRVQMEFSNEGRNYRLRVQDADALYSERYIDFADSFYDDRHLLSTGTRVRTVTTMDGSEAPRSILFSPDGRASATSVQLENRDNRRAVVHIDPSVDSVRVVMEAKNP